MSALLPISNELEVTLLSNLQATTAAACGTERAREGAGCDDEDVDVESDVDEDADAEARDPM